MIGWIGNSRGWTRRGMARCVFGSAAALVVLPLSLAQSINGRWSAVDRVLDNGEEHKTILELHQSGDKLSGKIES